MNYNTKITYIRPPHEAPVPDDLHPLQITPTRGIILRRSGKRYYIADTYKGYRVSGWRRLSVLRLAELLAHYEAYSIADMTVSMTLEGF